MAALHAVPTSSSAYVAAQRAAVEATLLRHDAGAADDDELRAAAALLERLDLDPVTTSACGWPCSTRPSTGSARAPGPERRCWAAPGRSVRCGSRWSGACAALARLAPNRAEKIALVDRANAAHPRTLR